MIISFLLREKLEYSGGVVSSGGLLQRSRGSQSFLGKTSLCAHTAFRWWHLELIRQQFPILSTPSPHQLLTFLVRCFLGQHVQA